MAGVIATGVSPTVGAVEPSGTKPEDVVTELAEGDSIRIESQDWETITTERQELEPGIVNEMQAVPPSPACIRTEIEKGFVQVYNNCGFDVRVKVTMAFAPDSSCSLVIDGTRHNISPAFGRIDRVDFC